MSTMNQFLAQFYGTVGASQEKTASAQTQEAPAPAGPSQEDLVKQAQYELFVKTASANGIDLSKLTDAQVDELFERTKTAGAMPPQFMQHAKGKEDDCGDDDKKKRDAAEKEHQEKKADMERFQQADFFGRQAAHAYVDELKKIASAAQTEQEKKATAAPATTPAAVGTDKVASRLTKQASATDQLAAKHAIALIGEFNKTASAPFDLKEAEARVNAVVFTLGLPESVKVAAAADLDTAIFTRALEALEVAGYPVQWGDGQ